MNDLVLKGGRLVDPSQGLDKVTDIAFAGGKVSAIGDGLTGKDTRDVKGKIVSPGLIDLHTHVYWGGTSLGVEAELLARTGGVTTFIDAGSAGPGNFHGFRKHVIEPSPVRILPYLNVSFPGIFAFHTAVMIGENTDIRLINPRECVRVALEHADLVVGIKVRVGQIASGNNGMGPLNIAIEIADELGLPVMAHLDFGPPARAEVLAVLRAGDVLTHCFRPFPNAPADARGKIREEVLAARQRGVIFDIGHGGGSFGWRTARAMFANGFLPDCISSDVHVISIQGSAPNILDTMSKFLCLGMSLPEVVRASTLNPAAAVRRSDLGRLTPGAPGDAAVLEVKNGQFRYLDVLGEAMDGDSKLLARGVVLNGRWWHGDL